MFNVGGGELLVILMVALIVLGPTKLPDAARQMGRAMSELRKLSTGFQREMRQALEEPAAAKPAANKPGDPEQQSTAAAAGMYDDADESPSGKGTGPVSEASTDPDTAGDAEVDGG